MKRLGDLKRPGDLQKLLTLRNARLQRAQGALARQHGECEAAREKVSAASARVLEHRDWQQERERELLGELLACRVTVNAIERVRASLTVLDEQQDTLERAARQADQTMRAALDRKQTLAVERDRRRREQDKIVSLATQALPAARRRSELHAEVEQEERLQGNASRPNSSRS